VDDGHRPGVVALEALGAVGRLLRPLRVVEVSGRPCDGVRTRVSRRGSESWLQQQVAVPGTWAMALSSRMPKPILQLDVDVMLCDSGDFARRSVYRRGCWR
jgi:hypothetical protein